MDTNKPSVTLDQVRAFVLNKQGLTGPGYKTVYDAALATIGAYGTSPTCYLTFAARVKNFRNSDLDKELYSQRRLIRLRCMRESSYMIPIDQLSTVVAATYTGDKSQKRLLDLSNVSDEEYAKLVKQVTKIIKKHSSLSVTDIRKHLGDTAPKGQGLQFTIALMGRQMILVRANVQGSWTSDKYTYALWKDWLGVHLQKMPLETGQAELARLYFQAFGPATVDDFKWWVTMKKREAVAAVEALGSALTNVTITNKNSADVEVLVLTEELPKLLRAKKNQAEGVRLLPVWDTYIMGYAKRERFITEENYKRMYDKAGNGTSTILINGVVEGIWEFETKTISTGELLTIRMAPFNAKVKQEWKVIENECQKIANAIGASDLQIELTPPPGNLEDGARNAFLSPITLGKKQ